MSMRSTMSSPALRGMTRPAAHALLAFAVLATAACPTAAPPAQSTAKAAQSGSAKHPGRIAVTIMFAPEPNGDPVASARSAVARLAPSLKLVPEWPERLSSLAEPAVHLKLLERADFDPPDLETLHYKGRGVTEAQGTALQGSKRALRLAFVAPHPHQHTTARAAAMVAQEVATKAGGVIYDEETRELFSVEQWGETRIGGFDGAVPDVVRHITIHAYQDGELYRAITLGMSKFGCPDLVVNQFPKSYWDSVGSLINLAAQTLVEAERLPGSGAFEVNIDRLKVEPLRRSLIDSLEPGALRRARLTYGAAPRQAGDPPNDLIELTFGGSEGESLSERQSALLSSLFGASDSVTPVRHDEALLRVSEAARERLVKLKKPQFLQGLPLGERLLVKGPFATPDGGAEWMWVEVTRWEGPIIHGLLMNDPVEVQNLRAGAAVVVDEVRAFDYLHYKADGTAEGNETGELMKQQ